jgi:diguanylate cyclase (GGDEF)-like protein
MMTYVYGLLDGVEVCQRLREAPGKPYTYVIMLTAREDTSDVVAALEAGADDYLTKPYETPELRARVGVAERFVALHEQLESANADLLQQALTDALTGLLNRGAALRRLDEELARADRLRAPLAVLMCDIDHFKRVNDAYGHPAGDAVLKEVAWRLKKTLRGYDTVGRYGGEEFILILPGLSMADAQNVSDRLRSMVGSKPVPLGGEALGVTVSMGAVVLEPGTAAEAGALIKAADARLYQAKDSGRNCCRIELFAES